MNILQCVKQQRDSSECTFIYSLKAVFNNRGMQINTHVCDCVCACAWRLHEQTHNMNNVSKQQRKGRWRHVVLPPRPQLQLS